MRIYTAEELQYFGERELIELIIKLQEQLLTTNPITK